MSKLIVNEIEKYDASQLTITTGTDVSIGSDLTVSGALNATLSTASQTNITSVGTLSSLDVSGDLTVDTDTLYVDSTNNYVGIGVVPDSLLSVGANLNNAITFDYDFNVRGALIHGIGSGESYLYLHRDDLTISADNVLGSINFSGADGGSYVGASIKGVAAGSWNSSNSMSSLVFETTANGGTSPSERLRIDSSGNVGIGESNPSTNLHLSSSFPRFRMEDTDGGYGEILAGSGSLVLRSDEGNSEADSNIRFEVDGSERMRLTSDGYLSIDSGRKYAALSIGKSIPLGLPNKTVNDSGSWNNEGNSHIFIDSGNNAMVVGVQKDSNARRGWIQVGHDDSNFASSLGELALQPLGGQVAINKFSADVSLDVEGFIRASSGMLFGTDTATANVLDDYEEGTFTPVYEGSDSAGTYTYGDQAGIYTKIGNVVTLTFQLKDINTSVLGSGAIKITGLPFTSVNQSNIFNVGSVNLSRFTVTGYQVVPQIINNTDYILLRELLSGSGAGTTLDVSDKASNSADISVTITYQAS